MIDADYLRQQAETCIRLARATFDLTTAERLRFMAADMQSKARQLENGEIPDPHMMRGNGYSGSNGNSDRGA